MHHLDLAATKTVTVPKEDSEQDCWQNLERALDAHGEGLPGVMDPEAVIRWEQHERAGHLEKRKDCPVCQTSDGTVVRHMGNHEPSYGVLHCDLAGPMDYPTGVNGERFLLVMALRAQDPEGKPCLLPWVEPIIRKDAVTVGNQIAELIDRLPNVKHFHGVLVRRLMTDKGTEFANTFVDKIASQRGVSVSHSPPHQPQSNGVAERMIGLVKTCSEKTFESLRPGSYILEFCSGVCG